MILRSSIRLVVLISTMAFLSVNFLSAGLTFMAHSQTEYEVNAKADVEANADVNAKADVEAKVDVDAKADLDAKADVNAKDEFEVKAEVEAKDEFEAKAQVPQAAPLSFSSQAVVQANWNAGEGSESSSKGDSAHASTLLSNTVSVRSDEVVVGQNITVSLMANVASGTVGAATIDVQYDPTIVTVTGCRSVLSGTSYYGECNATYSNDTVRYAALSASGISGELHLADIGFQALGDVSQSSMLTVTTVTFIDPSGDSVPVTVENGQLTVVTPDLFIDNASADEDAGQMTFALTLSSPSSLPVTVDFSTSDGTATAGEDYDATSGTLTILAGETSGTVSVTITDDALDEEDHEIFFVNLLTATNADLLDGQGVGTIADNDDPPTVTLRLSDDTLEESGGSASVEAILSEPSARLVTVNLDFRGSASRNDDYIASADQIVIPARSSSSPISLMAKDDVQEEGDETIVVDITSVTNGTENGVQQVSATITDDDYAPQTITISGETRGGIEKPYTFTATIDPAETTLPITYTWEATGQSAITNSHSNRVDSVPFTWNTPGTKTITVTAHNVSGQTTQNYTIVLDTPPTQVTISGSASGCYNGTHTFTAMVEPNDTTTPLTYTWQATDQQPITQSHNELMHTVSFRWTEETPFGDKTITVSAANLSGMMTGSRTINIQAIPCTATPTVTLTPTPSNTPTGTPTPTPTNTPTPSATATSTNTPTPSATATGTPPTSTPTVADTPSTATPTTTGTPPTSTATPSVTVTGTPPTPISTPDPTALGQVYLPLLLNGSSAQAPPTATVTPPVPPTITPPPPPTITPPPPPTITLPPVPTITPPPVPTITPPPPP